MKRNKVFVLNPGSHTLKFGLSDQESPLEIPHVISYKGDPLPVKPEITSKISENEVCFLRRKLLEGRNLLNPLEKKAVDPLVIKSFMEKDEDLYFEEIDIKKENVVAPPSNENENLDYVVGSSSEIFSKTFFPISQGHLNYELYKYSTQRIKDDLYRIWNEALSISLKGIENPVLSEYGVVLVVSDLIRSEDLEVMLEIVFDLFGFGCCFVHQESVCATFGCGIGTTTGLCVIDMGHTKSNIVCIRNGLIMEGTRVLLPFGGFEVTKSLVGIIHHCNFPLNSLFEYKTANKSPSSTSKRMVDEEEEEEEEGTTNDQSVVVSSIEGNEDVYNIRNNFEILSIFNKLKESHCYYPASLSQKELFQFVTIIHQSSKYDFHLGDPLVIPVMGYFNPLLYFPFQRTIDHAEKYRSDPVDGRRGIVDDSKVYDLNYVEFLKHNFKTGFFSSYQEYEDIQNEEFEDEEEEGEDDEDVDGYDENHVRMWQKKQQKKEEEERKKKKKKRKKKKKKDVGVVMTFQDAVIRSVEKSGKNLRRKRKRKKGTNDIDIDLLIIGGGAYLRGVIPKLQYLLSDYFTKKYRGVQAGFDFDGEDDEEEEKKKKRSNKRKKSTAKKKKKKKKKKLETITIGSSDSTQKRNVVPPQQQQQQQQQQQNKKSNNNNIKVVTKVNISIFPYINNDDKKADLRHLSWKGGALTPTFKTIKKMWIEREEFQNFGMKAVKKCLPFVLQ